jgi:hypothetical protein
MTVADQATNLTTTHAISRRSREWLSLAGALALGPLFIVVGYSLGLVFAPASYYFFACCLLIVPLLTIAAGRYKFLAWQLAVLSLALAVAGDNLRLHAIHYIEVPGLVYGFWAIGVLLSSPVPVYFLLRALKGRRRYVAGILVVVVAVALWLGFSLMRFSLIH